MKAGRQWRPEGKAANCCLPKTLRSIEDFFSPARWRVIEALTTKAPKGCAAPQPDGSWYCKITLAKAADAAGVTRKTVRGTIRQAHGISFVVPFDKEEKGGRRISTTYHIRAWEPTLDAIRKDPKYFHTAAGHVVGVGRNPRILLPPDAPVWRLDRNAPPPPRHPVFADVTQRRAARPDAMDINRVMDAFRRAGAPLDEKGAARALVIAQMAFAETGEAGRISAENVEALILQIGREYKPKAEFPRPAIGWFIGRRKNTGKVELAERVKAWAALHRPQSRTG
jgi:hypothetical protein